MSEHAEVAKEVKKILRSQFPKVKFSVKSKSYTGGDSIDIHWTDGPDERAIRAMVDKYESGSFDAMQDLYVYDHDRMGPTVKYVCCNRHFSDEKWGQAIRRIEERYAVNLQDERAIFDKFNRWPNDLIRRELRGMEA